MGKKILSQLEALARWLQLNYMNRRRTKEIIEPGRVLFHPQSCQDRILKAYQKRLKKRKLEKN